MKNNRQLHLWMSKFGQAYTDRWNKSSHEQDQYTKRIFGVSISELFQSVIIGRRIHSILEVGCNTGRKLEILKGFGSFQLTGIDPQLYALQKARRRLSTINFIEGTVYDLPFKNKYFDLVFTYEVLIHIPPRRMKQALNEIYRVSKKYILGMEYYSAKPVEVEYRSEKELLWKRDFESMYLENFPKLHIVKSSILEWNKSVYGRTGLYSKLFLLSK